MKYLHVVLAAIALISSTFAAPTAKSNCGPSDGPCDPGYCCSKYGWCGKTTDHCGKGCQSEFGECEGKKISTNNKCGPDNGNTICPYGKCCSKYGWCGTSTDHCGVGCQSEFGKCNTQKTTQKTNKWVNDYGTVEKEARVYAQEIWDFLVDKLDNKNGAAGMIGNIYAESRLRPNDLEKKYENQFGLNDEQYTKGVDNGTYKKFTTDHGGYGLCQWTSEPRKTNLLAYAKEHGKSIGDLYMQLDFLWYELTTTKKYESLLQTLKTTNSVQTASDKVVLEFEIPKNRGPDVLDLRAKYGRMLKAACE